MTKRKHGLWDTKRTVYYGAITPPTTTAPTPWEQEQKPALPPIAWGYRKTPMGRADSIEAGVKVPFWQGVIVGFFPGFVSGMLAGVIVGLIHWPWWIAPTVGISVWACVAGWRVWKFVDLRQEVLWQRERLERHALDGDSHIGKLEDDVPALMLNIQYKEGEYSRQRRLDIPKWVDLTTLYLFARAALNGLPISEAEWTPSSRGFSVRRYRQLMNLFENADPPILERVNPNVENSARQLTEYGRMVFKELVNTSPPPPR